MLEHTQTICRQQSTNCLSVLDYFVRLALKESKNRLSKVFGKFSRLTHKELKSCICFCFIQIMLHFFTTELNVADQIHRDRTSEKTYIYINKIYNGKTVLYS